MGSGVPSLPDYDQLLLEDKDGDGSVQREEATGAARMHFPYIDANKDDGIDRNEWQTMKDIFQRSENALLAIQPAESANKDPILAWKQTRGLPYVPSPLAYTKRIFLVKNGGMVSCLDASSGAFVYREERVGALGDYYASPIGVGKPCSNRLSAGNHHGIERSFRELESGSSDRLRRRDHGNAGHGFRAPFCA